jgi:large subunit ribosomal protein L34
MSQTYQPKKKKRAVTHGFLVRSASADGRKVLARRRQKGRKKLTVSQDK